MQDLENYRAFALYLYVALERSKRTRSRCDISPGENQATTEAHSTFAVRRQCWKSQEGRADATTVGRPREAGDCAQRHMRQCSALSPTLLLARSQ